MRFYLCTRVRFVGDLTVLLVSNDMQTDQFRPNHLCVVFCLCPLSGAFAETVRDQQLEEAVEIIEQIQSTLKETVSGPACACVRALICLCMCLCTEGSEFRQVRGCLYTFFKQAHLVSE